MDEVMQQPEGVGMSNVEQSLPASTVARERFNEIIKNNTKVIADCQAMLALLDENPSLDDSMCRLFGITRTPGVVSGTAR